MSQEIESAYEAKKYEDSIYKKWQESGAFKAKIDQTKKPFSIALPPPNATGKLHLGHATMLAVEDVMVRYHRMKGHPCLWLPGTDHAAIATQSVVEKKLQSEGIANPRKQLGREKLLNEIKNFVEDSKNNIRSQMRRMGASCDWSREKYTLDESMNNAVNTLFKAMYEDGVIYRGDRIVNWDPNMQTTVADDEVEHIEENAEFYYFQFGPVVIGTARPETKFLDKIIVVHPDDERYKDLHGKEFTHEWIEGEITSRVIADPCIDMEMGTGAMTITPAHSLVDFELAEKYKLEKPQIIDFNGNIRQEVSKEFGTMPISEARKKIIQRLKEKGLLVKIDQNYQHNIAVNYRGKGQIEPQIMKQWFIDVNKKVIDWKGSKLSIKEVLQDTVRSKMIEIVPERFEKTYFHWIDHLRDWCISRQIWWGHQIPMWYKVTKEQHEKFNEIKDASSTLLSVLAVNGEVRFGTEKPSEEGLWIRDPDTLDTWFSSSLWTFATLGWPEKTPDLEYFHPTSVLETGYDIIFFWVARMILASTYALRRDNFPEEKCIPFKTVYLHGLIRDRNGKKMSKSNPETCIDPLDMIDKYGADALRLSLILGSTPGNDMSLYEEKIAGYRNFVNKIWNASRFALMNIPQENFEQEFKKSEIASTADKWILSELQNLIIEVDEDFGKNRFSDAGTKIYEFLWSKYCDWYLEMSKGSMKNEAVLTFVLKTTLKLLHPFTPFVSEKLWEFISPNSILISEQWPETDPDLTFKDAQNQIKLIQEIITGIRSARAELRVEPAKKISAIIYAGADSAVILENQEIIINLARLEKLEVSEKGDKIPQAKSIFIEDIEIHLPMKGMIDPEKEKARIQKEIENKEKFISAINAKLGNEGFLKNAPDDLISEQKGKLEEYMEAVSKLKSQFSEL